MSFPLTCESAWGNRIVKLTDEMRNVTLQAAIQRIRLAGLATNQIRGLFAVGRCNGDFAVAAQFRRWTDIDRVAGKGRRYLCLGLLVTMGVITG